ncbi:hypothetical protein HMPREF1129_1846, partial [Actinomyces naeslundii str. Howell 279]
MCVSHRGAPFRVIRVSGARRASDRNRFRRHQQELQGRHEYVSSLKKMLILTVALSSPSSGWRPAAGGPRRRSRSRPSGCHHPIRIHRKRRRWAWSGRLHRSLLPDRPAHRGRPAHRDHHRASGLRDRPVHQDHPGRFRTRAERDDHWRHCRGPAVSECPIRPRTSPPAAPPRQPLRRRGGGTRDHEPWLGPSWRCQR